MSAASKTGYWRAHWDGTLKFVWNDLGGRYLFDLDSDPGESENLVATEPKRAGAREELLLRTFADLPRPSGDAGPEIAIDPETVEALRRMGYLGDAEPAP